MRFASPQLRNGCAWLLLTAALALHVWDEAANDFLSVYNPAVIRIRETAPWLPLPTYTFEGWLSGLTIGVALLAVASVAVFSGSRFAALAGYPYAAMMMLNALAHLAGSAFTHRFLPGVYSSPLMLAASIWLWNSTVHRNRPAAKRSAAA